MLRDNLVGLIVPMQSCRTQVLGDEFSYLENPRPVGAESLLTGRCSSPFQTEPRQTQGAEYLDCHYGGDVGTSGEARTKNSVHFSPSTFRSEPCAGAVFKVTDSVAGFAHRGLPVAFRGKFSEGGNTSKTE